MEIPLNNVKQDIFTLKDLHIHLACSKWDDYFTHRYTE